MSEITDYQIAQPYKGTPEEVMEFFNPARTTTQLADATDSINTKNKRLGRTCYNSTLQLLYVADGPAPTDTWTLINGLGTTQVTPS